MQDVKQGLICLSKVFPTALDDLYKVQMEGEFPVDGEVLKMLLFSEDIMPHCNKPRLLEDLLNQTHDYSKYTEPTTFEEPVYWVSLSVHSLCVCTYICIWDGHFKLAMSWPKNTAGWACIWEATEYFQQPQASLWLKDSSFENKHSPSNLETPQFLGIQR